MKFKSINQMTCIQAADAETFEARVNEVLFRVTFPKIELDKNVPFTAYIWYRIEKEIPETLAECYQVHGAGRKCGDCVHFKPVKDKRRKWHPCEYASYKKTQIEADACDRFYIELEEAKEARKQAQAGRHDQRGGVLANNWEVMQ